MQSPHLLLVRRVHEQESTGLARVCLREPAAVDSGDRMPNEKIRGLLTRGGEQFVQIPVRPIPARARRFPGPTDRRRSRSISGEPRGCQGEAPHVPAVRQRIVRGLGTIPPDMAGKAVRTEGKAQLWPKARDKERLGRAKLAVARKSPGAYRPKLESTSLIFSGVYARLTSSACNPFGPCFTIKDTRAPSSRDR